MPVNQRILQRPFDPLGYEYDPKNYVYVPGRLVQQRLVAACGADWGIVSQEWTQFKMPPSQSGKACLGLEVTIGLRIGDGGPFVGCGQGNWYEGSDQDTVKRGALTAAVRSAASFAGVGLELYPESAIDHWLDWLDLLDKDDQAQWQDARALLARVKTWRDSHKCSPDFKEVWGPGVKFVLQRIDAGLNGTEFKRADAPQVDLSAHGGQSRADERREPRPQSAPRGDVQQDADEYDNVDWKGPNAADRKSPCVYCGAWLEIGEMKYYGNNPFHVKGSEDKREKYPSVSAHATCVCARRGDGSQPDTGEQPEHPSGRHADDQPPPKNKWDDDSGDDPFGPDA